MDHMNCELGHARLVVSIPFNNPFCYMEGQQILWPMWFPLQLKHMIFWD